MVSKKDLITAVAVLALGAAAVFPAGGTSEIITYQKEVARGETLWGICSKIASDQDNLSELVYRTMQENGITDPANLQPGTLVVVHVKAVKS